jgi:hypothetical protein
LNLTAVRGNGHVLEGLGADVFGLDGQVREPALAVRASSAERTADLPAAPVVRTAGRAAREVAGAILFANLPGGAFVVAGASDRAERLADFACGAGSATGSDFSTLTTTAGVAEISRTGVAGGARLAAPARSSDCAPAGFATRGHRAGRTALPTPARFSALTGVAGHGWWWSRLVVTARGDDERP